MRAEDAEGEIKRINLEGQYDWWLACCACGQQKSYQEEENKRRDGSGEHRQMGVEMGFNCITLCQLHLHFVGEIMYLPCVCVCVCVIECAQKCVYL